MNTSYIYSASRVSTLAEQLLNKTDIDRLLVATPGKKLTSALKETYLAPYLLQVPDEDVAQAIELTMIEAKNLISQIAPEASQFAVLWVQYDVHNLRVLAKATKEKLPVEQLTPFLSKRGTYPIDTLVQHSNAGTLSHLHDGWQQAFDQALEYVSRGALDKVDQVFDVLVLTTMRAIASKATDPFIATYTKAVIDIHNIKSYLRYEKLATKIPSPEFIRGGTVAEASLVGADSVATTLVRFAPGQFDSALESYVASGHSTVLDARFDEYLIKLASAGSLSLFSAASLVTYYLKVRQAATNIRTIVVGLQSGQAGEVIRSNVRFAHVTN